MKSKEIVEHCDNPECDYDQIIESGRGAEGAIGYHFGKGYWVLGGGGPIPAFYAHEEACILPALKAVMD